MSVYPVVRWHIVRRIRRTVVNATARPLVVYSMPKTGTETVKHALRAAAPDRPVFKVHTLDRSRIRELESLQRSTNGSTRSLWTSQALASLMPTRRQPWDVISLTREPLAQAMSLFFMNGQRLGRFELTTPVDSVVETFLREWDFHRAVRWFDDELSASLGVDVYQHDFEPSQGFAVIERPEVRVLLLRLESLQEKGADALSTFLDRDVVLSESHNLGDRMPYSDLYSLFRDQPLPEQLVEQLHGSRYARHFYDPEELDRARKRWNLVPSGSEFQFET